MARPDWETVWTFDTPRFRVALEVTQEDMDPADSFEFDEDIAAVRNGRVEWFVAAVVVYFGETEDNLEEISRDVLCGCAYESVREFFTAHRDADPMNRNCSIMRAKRGKVTICHYFPSMVSEAIREARKSIAARSGELAAQAQQWVDVARTMRGTAVPSV